MNIEQKLIIPIRRATEATNQGVSVSADELGTMNNYEPKEVGPNGYRVGYTKEGDKVEWLPDEENPDQEWPLILRRNDNAIQETYNKLSDLVWWSRHQLRLQKINSGVEILAEKQKPLLAQAKRKATQIEKQYGIENLKCNSINWGLLHGRMSALSWVMGAEWDESLDT